MKSYQERFYKFSALMLVPALIAACGGGDTSGGPPLGGGGGGGGGDPTVNPPQTIAITAPQSNAIIDDSNGIYRRKGTVLVTDTEGNRVADGTRVNFFLIDSVLAKGIIDGTETDSISGLLLTDSGPSGPIAGDGSATGFDSATVIRNASTQSIAAGHHVLLLNAEGEDKVRLVSSASSSNTLQVSSAYTNSYPNAVYNGTSNITGYVVGASLLGAHIEDESGTLGSAVTSNGEASFYVVYPANVGTIRTGCFNDLTVDTRSPPAGSGDVYVVAQVEGSPDVSAVSQGFCFSSIKGGTITAVPDALNGDGTVRVTVEDGGDGVRLPFWGINANAVVSGNVSVSVAPSLTTNNSGFVDVGITVSGGDPGDTAVVTFTKEPGITATVNITVP